MISICGITAFVNICFVINRQMIIVDLKRKIAEEIPVSECAFNLKRMGIDVYLKSMISF